MPSVQTQDERHKAVVAPAHLTNEMSLLDYLANCQPPIDKKLIDIALVQTQTPHSLREDAAQEIRIMWATLKPNIERYEPGQIAAYAHFVAKHASWRLRRALGSPVNLPGSAFRKRKDGTSYVTPGVLSVPLDWHDLEHWFNTSESMEQGEFLRESETFQMPDFEAIAESAIEGNEAVDDAEDQLRHRPPQAT